jgi:peptide/nickel transport system ATP-binding protein
VTQRSLLKVRDVSVTFYPGDPERRFRPVVEVFFEVRFGEILGLVGESGCGKSLSALTIPNLLPEEARGDGRITINGDEHEAGSDSLSTLRGNDIGYISQEPQSALNPVFSVGYHLNETLKQLRELDEQSRYEESVRLLERVQLDRPEKRLEQYPHELSGGQRQRVVIALALAGEPDLLIADEPTTALDVMTEAKILGELETLSEEFDTSIALITHDLGVIAELVDRVVVMYAGRPVEKAPVDELFYDPKHPYTVGLMASIPRIGTGADRLKTIPGTMPDLIEVPSGCSFHPRCPYAEEACTKKDPMLVEPETGDPADAENKRGVSCLEYTGDLTQGLSFDVSVDNTAVGEHNE